MIRSLFSATLQRAFAFAGWMLHVAARWSSRPVGLAVVYHGIAPTQGKHLTELVPPQSTAEFAGQVDLLRRRYRLVTASELPDAVRTRRRGQRIPLAITFDDDVSSHVEYAMPLLRAAGAPATFFLCGATLEAPYRQWWERLQDAVDRDLDLRPVLSHAGLSVRAVGADIFAVGKAIETMEPPKRRALHAALGELVGPDPDGAGLRAADVRALADAGHEIGFHTREHHPLAFLDSEDLRAAMMDGRGELERAAGVPMRSIGYPHGTGDSRVAAAARDAGFETGFTLAQMPVTPDDDQLLLGRYEPWGVSLPLMGLALARIALRRSPVTPAP